jgi:hypothetical protein
MCVADMYPVYSNHDKQKYDKLDIIQFADGISLNLRVRTPRNAPTLAADLNALKEQDMRLEHISNELGEIYRHPKN